MAFLAGPAHSAPARTPSSAPLRWTEATPDGMVEDAVVRAQAADASEAEREAALAVIAALSGTASSDKARLGLEHIAGATTVPADVGGDAALLARMMAADEGTESGTRADRKHGVVDRLSILGPFRDTGGGLDAHDGPEDAKAYFAPNERYAWGAFDVTWRAVPRAYATASGVPLDLFVSPRKESCTWVGTWLTVPKAQSLVLRVASTGQVRAVFDGATVARDDRLHAMARFDRVAARVDAAKGGHLFAAKVCSGAPDDDGRVRLRVTDTNGAWPEGVTAGAWPGPVQAAKAASTPVRTPLERALEPAAGDTDARLDAGILRTLGGADDLRSPRASGLLVALVDGGLEGDRLAMAAWVAPSGANRSAWLNRVRQGDDAAARAFAERRLVERHLDAQLADWAMATLRGAKLDEAVDGEAALLSARVELTLGTDALRMRALHRLERAADSEGAAAPDLLLQSLAQVAAGLDPRRARDTWEKIARRGTPGGDYVRAVGSSGSKDDLIAAAARAFEAGGLEDADDALEAAQAVAQSGAHDEARALYEQLARWSPNRSGVWTGLAQEIAASRGDATKDASIMAALRRGRELDPGDARTRAELALRARAPSLQAEARDDEKYLVSSQTILARRKGVARPAEVAAGAAALPGEPGAKASPPAASGSSDSSGVRDGASSPDGARAGRDQDVADRELHWLRAVVMHPDRRVSELVHYAREIVIPPRTEDELYEQVPAEGDLTEIVRARVHRKDGSSAFPVEEANENAQPRIRWPELAPGDVVEVAFRSWTAGPVGGRGDPPFFRRDYAGSVATHPVLYNEDILEYPPERPIFFDIVNGKADRREEKDENGRHVVRLVWDSPPNVEDEPMAPPISEVIPVLVLSTFKDWGSFRAWYQEAVHGFTEPDAQVRELAAQLTKGKASRDEKLRALFDFVADDIRYVNYQSAEYWLPNRPQQLLARREGDCDDKAILLITLLKAVGIDAQEVMVQARGDDAQPSVVRAHSAAIPLFNHGIAYLPGPNGGTYLDATSPQSRLGPLPSMDARAPALRMEGPAEIVTLPASSPEDHGVESVWNVQLTTAGGATLSGEEHATGDDAFWMRTNLTEAGARPQWVEDHLVGPWFPTVEVDKKVDFVADAGRGAATAKWKAVSEGVARREGAELVVPLSPSQTLASQLAPLVKRTLPVWLPSYVAPRRESRTIHVFAPKGWTFEPSPQGGDENGGPFGRAHLEIAPDPADKRAVLVRRSVVFDQGTISVEEYPKWRAWVQRVDALMHKSLRLEAAPRAGGAS